MNCVSLIINKAMLYFICLSATWMDKLLVKWLFKDFVHLKKKMSCILFESPSSVVYVAFFFLTRAFNSIF